MALPRCLANRTFRGVPLVRVAVVALTVLGGLALTGVIATAMQGFGSGENTCAEQLA